MTTSNPQPSGIQVVDREGRSRMVSAEEAWAGYAAGQYGFQKGQAVPVLDEQGAAGTINAEDLPTALAAGQVQPATFDQVLQAEKAATYGGRLGEATTYGAGLLDTATFGGYTAGLVGIGGDEARNTLNELRAANPNAALAGEISGAIVPALFTGGTSAAAQGGNLLTRGANLAGRIFYAPTRLAEGAATLTKGLVGVEATGLLGRGLQTALPLAAQGAVEGAFQGLGQAVTESTLKNRDLTVESLASGALHGGAMGGAFGGALGLAGAGLKAGKSALLREGVADALTTAGGPYRAPGVNGAADVAQEAAGDGWRGWLRKFSEEKAVRATGPTQKQIGELERMGKAFPEAKERVSQMLLQELPAEAGKGSLASMSRREILNAAEEANQRAGSRIGDVLRKLDAPEFIEHQPDVIGIVQRARTEIADPLQKGAFSKADAAKIDGYIDNLLESNTGSGFSDLHKARVRLDADIKFHKTTASPFETELRKLRGLIENEIEAKADEAASALGGEFGTTYKAAKADYAASKWIQTAAERGVKAEGANRSISLGDHLFGIAGGALGGSLGPLVGLASAAASGAVSNAIRNRGDQVAAALAARIAGQEQALSRLAYLDRVGAGSKDRLAKAVGGLLGGGDNVKRLPPAAVRALGSTSEERKDGFIKERERILKAVRDPSEVRRQTAQFADVAPQLAAQVEQRAQKNAAWLASKLPEEPRRPSLQATLKRDTTKLADDQILRWARYLEGAKDPEGTLQDAARGQATREQLEALRELHPATYSEVRRTLLDQVADMTAKNEPLAYDARLRASALLGEPVDSSVDPGFVADMQAAYAGSGPQQAAPTGAAPSPVAMGRIDNLTGPSLAESESASIAKGIT